MAPSDAVRIMDLYNQAPAAAAPATPPSTAACAVAPQTASRDAASSSQTAPDVNYVYEHSPNVGLAYRQMDIARAGVSQIEHAVQAVNPLAYTGHHDQRANRKMQFLGGANPHAVREGTLHHQLDAHPLTFQPIFGPAGLAPPPPAADDSAQEPPESAPQLSIRQRPAPIPDAVRSRKTTTLGKILQSKNPEQSAEMRENARVYTARELMRCNQHSSDKRAVFQTKWRDTLRFLEPGLEITEDNMWRDHFILKWTKGIMQVMVENNPGSQGNERVRASTVHAWATTCIFCIVAFCYDKGGKANGPDILIRHNLFDQIRQCAADLIEKYDLDQYPKEKHYYYVQELILVWQTLIDGGMRLSGETMLVKFQTGISAKLTLYTTIRPGTAASSHDHYRKQGRYMKIGDVRILKVSRFAFDVIIRGKYFKGFNDTHSMQRDYYLQHVHNPDNIPSDVGGDITNFLRERSALKGITTIDDLWNFEGAEIEIVEEMKHLPLFCLTGNSGTKFFEGQPCLSKNLSANVRTAIIDAGLPAAGLAAFRRGSANMLGIKRDPRAARMALNHASGRDTFTNYYDRNTFNYNYVGIHLDEEPGELTPQQKEAVALHRFTSAAVTALVHLPQEQRTVGRETGRKIVPLSPEDEAQLASDPKLVALAEAEGAAWQALLDCYDLPEDLALTQERKSVKRLEKFLRKDGISAEIAETCKVAFLQALDARAQAVKLAKKALRRVTLKNKEKETTAPGSSKNTLANRNAAVDVVSGSSVAQSIMQSVLSTADDPPDVPVNPDTDEHCDVDVHEAFCADDFATGFEKSMVSFANETYAPDDENEERDLRWMRSSANKGFLDTLDKAVQAEHGDNRPRVNFDMEATVARQRQNRMQAASSGGCAVSDDQWIPDVTEEEWNAVTMKDGMEYVAIDEPVQRSPDDPFSKVSTDTMRYLYYRSIFRPLHEYRKDMEQYHNDGDKWVCHECAPLDAVRKKPAEPYSDYSHFSQHKELHTEWHFLELKFASKDSDGNIAYSCPSCGHFAKSATAMRKHMKESCKDSEKYLQLYYVHMNRKSNYNKSKSLAQAAIAQQKRSPHTVATETNQSDVGNDADADGGLAGLEYVRHLYAGLQAISVDEVSAFARKPTAVADGIDSEEVAAAFEALKEIIEKHSWEDYTTHFTPLK